MKREDILNSFFNTLTVKKRVILVDKIGLFDTTINKTNIIVKKNFEFLIKDLFIFTNDSLLVSHIKFRKTQMDYSATVNRISILIKNIIKLSPMEISFNQISQNGEDYYFLQLLNCNFVFACVTHQSSSGYLIKLYMMHMMIAFFNFIGENCEILERPISEKEKDKDKDRFVYNERSLKYLTSGCFQAKLFEIYFAHPLTRHFEKLIRELFKKEELFLLNVKFKNFYLVDLSTNEIICDLCHVRGNKKYKKIHKNEKVWQEILYHSQKLKSQYIRATQDKCVLKSRKGYFVKVECTSTYPRLTFIIKFLPILHGVSLIHIFSQNKLSRQNDKDSLTQYKNYKEFDILYGNDLVTSYNNIEMRYNEPKKLSEIESFFVEFFISTNKRFDFFYENQHELKYIESSLINIIDEAIAQNKTSSVDCILGKINNRLYEAYTNLDEDRVKFDKMNNGENISNILITGNTNNENVLKELNERKKKRDSESESNSNNNRGNKNLNSSDEGENMNINANVNFMCIPFDFILTKLFESNPNFHFKGSLANEKENTLLLSKYEETQVNEQAFNKRENKDENNLDDFVNQLSEISRQVTDHIDYQDNDNDRPSGYFKTNISVVHNEFDQNLTGIEKKKSKESAGSCKNERHHRVRSGQNENNPDTKRKINKTLHQLQLDMNSIDKNKAREIKLPKYRKKSALNGISPIEELYTPPVLGRLSQDMQELRQPNQSYSNMKNAGNDINTESKQGKPKMRHFIPKDQRVISHVNKKSEDIPIQTDDILLQLQNSNRQLLSKRDMEDLPPKI